MLNETAMSKMIGQGDREGRVDIQCKRARQALRRYYKGGQGINGRGLRLRVKGDKKIER